jgi:hypothetical protein
MRLSNEPIISCEYLMITVFIGLSNARISGDHMVSGFDFQILRPESMLEKHVMFVGIFPISVVFIHVVYFETSSIRGEFRATKNGNWC